MQNIILAIQHRAIESSNQCIPVAVEVYCRPQKIPQERPLLLLPIILETSSGKISENFFPINSGGIVKRSVLESDNYKFYQ
jgi:hypothetical protein